METIILVTVLSTLGAVALVTAIVVAFVKLSKKVGVNEHEQQMSDLYNMLDEDKKNFSHRIDDFRQEMGHELDNLRRDINEEFRGVYDSVEQGRNELLDDIVETRRFIDSRCDKLDAKIQVTKLN